MRWLKDPNATLPYAIDFTDWLDTDTIDSVAWSAPGLTVASTSNTTTTATFTAYRYPTAEEIEAGRDSEDMIRIGDYASHDGAHRALPGGRGQIQAGRDGEVFSY